MKQYTVSIGYEITKDWHLIRVDTMIGKDKMMVEDIVPGSASKKKFCKAIAEAVLVLHELQNKNPQKRGKVK